MFYKKLNLQHHGYFINRISHDFKLKKNESLSKYNLTDSQMKVMRYLWHENCLSQTEIQKRMNIKPSSLTRLIDQLERKQFITRKISSKDSRVKLISLTEKGKILKKDSWDAIIMLEEKLIKNFTDEEKELSLSFLNRMLNNILTEGDDYNKSK